MLIAEWDWLYVVYPLAWVCIQANLTYPGDWKRTLRATYCIFTAALAFICGLSGAIGSYQCFDDRLHCVNSTTRFHIHSVLNFMFVTGIYYLQFTGKNQYHLHHFLVVSGWWMALHWDFVHFYVAMAMVSESTNVFLSLDFWYSVQNKKPDTLYEVNLVLLKICYAFFRLFFYPSIAIGLGYDWYNSEEAINPILPGVCYFTGIPIWLMSVYWFFNGVLQKSSKDLLDKKAK